MTYNIASCNTASPSALTFHLFSSVVWKKAGRLFLTDHPQFCSSVLKQETVQSGYYFSRTLKPRVFLQWRPYSWHFNMLRVCNCGPVSPPSVPKRAERSLRGALRNKTVKFALYLLRARDKLVLRGILVLTVKGKRYRFHPNCME